MMRFDILIFEVDTLINISKTNKDIEALKLEVYDIAIRWMEWKLKIIIRTCRSYVINLKIIFYIIVPFPSHLPQYVIWLELL